MPKKTLDYRLLRRELKRMNERSLLYLLIKTEVTKRGHWKPKPRGKPFQKGLDARRGKIT